MNGSGTPEDDDPLAYEIDISDPRLQPNGDIAYGAMTFFRGKNPNGEVPQVCDENRGRSLRLAVARDAYNGIAGDDALRNDRCELRDNKLPLGTAVWYSFEMRAAADFPVVDARCVCAQIKAPYYDLDGGSPLFALRIDRGRYLATIEHLYEIKDTEIVDGSEFSRHVRPYPGPGATGARALDHHVFGNTARDFKELQVRAVLATDAHGLQSHLENDFRWSTDLVAVRQEKALPEEIRDWSRFTVRVAPTDTKNEDGVLQLFVGVPGCDVDELVATAIGEFGHAGYADAVGNDGPPPGQGRQYFKIGPYRDKLRIWGGQAAAIHVRHVKRGAWRDGAELRDRLRG